MNNAPRTLPEYVLGDSNRHCSLFELLLCCPGGPQSEEGACSGKEKHVRLRGKQQTEQQTAITCIVHGLTAASYSSYSFFLLCLLLLYARASTARCLGSVAGPVSSWTWFNCCLSCFEVGIYFFIFDLTATGSNLELITEDELHNAATSD